MKPEHKIISVLQYAILIIVLVMCIYYAVDVFKRSTDFNSLYNALEGESPKYAKEAIAAAMDMPEENRDSEYYYRLGVIYQHNLHDNYHANKFYKQALRELEKELKENKQPNNDYLFITDRIADNARLAGNQTLQNMANNAQHIGIQIQMQNPVQYVNQDDWFNFTNTQKVQTTNNSVKANAIEQNKSFKSDSQNVHDSALTEFLREQFAKIKEYNQSEGINFSPEGFKPSQKDPAKAQRINYVLDTIKRNSHDTSLINGTEYDLLGSVWTRINSRSNAKNKEKLIESFEDQLNECATGPSSTVCVAGRCSHVISSLALLDKDPNLGVLKTKEVLRNELLDGAAKIVERYTGSDKITPQSVLDDFNANRVTPEVQKLKETMTNEITHLSSTYAGKLPDEQRALVVQQSLAVIND